jgi:carboxyl-terminal processing protease
MNGRKVFDGGGIAPDMALNPLMLSKITLSLILKNLIFDYATLYAYRNEKVPGVDALQITSTEYNNFLNFLKSKSFDYTTESDDQLDELIKVAKQEKYFTEAQDEFEALRKKLAHDKDKDLQTFNGEIKSLLFEEIASRYYYQKGRIQASLHEDPELDKAIEVLNDPELYVSILRESYGSANVRAGMSRVN